MKPVNPNTTQKAHELLNYLYDIAAKNQAELEPLF